MVDWIQACQQAWDMQELLLIVVAKCYVLARLYGYRITADDIDYTFMLGIFGVLSAQSQCPNQVLVTMVSVYVSRGYRSNDHQQNLSAPIRF